jgi:hypothetical protein
MDHVEKWLVDQAEKLPADSAGRHAILNVATAWHEEGGAVLAKQFGGES